MNARPPMHITTRDTWIKPGSVGARTCPSCNQLCCFQTPAQLESIHVRIQSMRVRIRKSAAAHGRLSVLVVSACLHAPEEVPACYMLTWRRSSPSLGDMLSGRNAQQSITDCGSDQRLGSMLSGRHA
eukprot:352872-Chlamydomonas_euryale.AAC.6